jgi:hypothetical protein
MSRRLLVVVALVALLAMGYTPRALLDLVTLTVGVLWRALHQPSPPAHSLKSAILNVTADFDEVPPAACAAGVAERDARAARRCRHRTLQPPSQVGRIKSSPPQTPRTLPFMQLCALVGDFLKSPAVAPGTEQQLRAFLEERAARSYPALETTLDWLLSMYKLALPFLVRPSRVQAGLQLQSHAGATRRALQTVWQACPT